MMSFVKTLKVEHGIDVKKIRMDNAGENLAFKKKSKNKGFGIEFKMASPRTPQQSGRVERKFATLFGYSQAMLNDCGFKKQMRQGLWTEAAATATQMHNILVDKDSGKSPY